MEEAVFQYPPAPAESQYRIAVRMVNSAVAEYVVHEVTGRDGVKPTDPPIYGLAFQPEPTPGNALLRCGIKWDGCSNLEWFDSGGTAPEHFCGLVAVEQMFGLLRALYADAKQRIAGWDGDD